RDHLIAAVPTRADLYLEVQGLHASPPLPFASTLHAIWLRAEKTAIVTANTGNGSKATCQSDSIPLILQPEIVIFMAAGRLAVGNGRHERGLGSGARPHTSATRGLRPQPAREP